LRRQQNAYCVEKSTQNGETINRTNGTNCL